MPVNKNTGYHTLSKDLSERIEQDRANHWVNPYACPDSAIIRRFDDHDKPHLWRPAFVMDVEKILHNNYYNRYSDKTQVISCYKNDDISRRALHVQLVSRIARTIGMTLGLNLDLIEAISLGHDIGHTPFGHAGERFLNALYNGHTGRLFNHNIHSARVLDHLIFRNVSLQVLDGVICHNGELEQQEYKPKRFSATDPWGEFDTNLEDCYTDPSANKRQIPGTLEGCIMRISDIIAYLGKDRQDALKIGLIENNNHFTSGTLGTTNAQIINNMTVSIIEHSYGKPYISMDKDVYETFSKAKTENYQTIYKNPQLNGRLTLVYDNIATALQTIYEVWQDYEGGLNYLEEGNTNFTYLYADESTKKVTTNKAEYANYADVKKSIEDMIESASKNPVKYMVIYPELKDFKTNMNVSYSDQWLNTRSYGYYSGGTKWKDVFAVAVDTKYPIQDQFYQTSIDYQNNIPQMKETLQFILSSAIL